MHWYHRNEMKKYVTQVVSEIEMVEYSDFLKYEKIT